MKTTFFFAVIFLITSTIMSAQVFRMSNAVYSTCSGSFTDSQGATPNYLPGETFTTTICPSLINYRSQIDFTSFDLAPGDVLIAYDGNSSSAPFIGSYGSFLSPTVVEASVSNSSGCITFVFTSNAASPGAPGWEANITCNSDCQTVLSNVTTVPAPESDGIIRVCQGTTIDITGNPAFSVDGTGATYAFKMPDDTIVNGSSTSLTLNDSGIYKVDYMVTDAQGCRDLTTVDVEIYVSTIPDFRGTEATTTDICLGDTVDITGMAETVVSTPNFAPPIAGTTFLPDGSGTSYITCIDVTRFDAGATINSAADLAGVFMDIEHSYVGDLDITLTAPNGTVIDLFFQAGGGTYFGEPIDNDNILGPGVGYIYNVTEGPRATQTLVAAVTALPFGASLPAGDYLPISPFSDLIGTELNGQWCIQVTDNLALDNGYIFEWGLTFSRTLFAPNLVFEPQPLTQGWLPGIDIINTSPDGSIITVQPSSPGRYCYDYELVDSFGCSYIEEVCINVTDVNQIAPNLSNYQVCGNGNSSQNIDLTLNTNALEIEAGGPVDNYYFSLSDAQNQINPITSSIITIFQGNPTADLFVRFGSNNQCFEIRPYTVELVTSLSVGSPSDLSIADFDGDQRGFFNLSFNDANILDGLSPADHSVNYYISANDAISDSNGIVNPSSFENTSNPQTIYARIQNINGDCFETTSFELSILDNNALDSDGDGIFNSQEDLNGNGDLTDDDTDSDNTPNYLDTDDDNDTVLTAVEIAGIGAGPIDGIYTFIDTDNNTIENYLDDDDDGDGLATALEDYDLDGNPLNDDTNNNSIPDFLDDAVTLSSERFEFQGLKVYPTLVQDYLTVDATQLSNTQKLTLKIFNISGKLIHNSQALLNRSIQEIHTSQLSKGVYFLKIENNLLETQVFKFVKR